MKMAASRRGDSELAEVPVGMPARVRSGQAHHTAVMHIGCMYRRWMHDTAPV
jgi:hypothetical protein